VPKPPDGAKILLYDIETAPNMAYVWGKYEQDVVAFVREWYVLCFAYKWLGSDRTHVVAQPDFRKEYKADPHDDRQVVAKLHEILSLADVVVGHNSVQFDTRKTNARFLFHGFDPPQPFKQVDTCLVARKVFNLNSNKLGDICTHLGIGDKASTGGFETWQGCMAGNRDAWARMKKYNAHDVDLLEKVYLRLRPWIVGHPNVAQLNGSHDSCPKCGGHNLTRKGYKYNRVTTMQQWQCQDCGGWSSSRLAQDVPKPALVN
jgi:RNase_H superfamily